MTALITQPAAPLLRPVATKGRRVRVAAPEAASAARPLPVPRATVAAVGVRACVADRTRVALHPRSRGESGGGWLTDRGVALVLAMVTLMVLGGAVLCIGVAAVRVVADPVAPGGESRARVTGGSSGVVLALVARGAYSTYI